MIFLLLKQSTIFNNFVCIYNYIYLKRVCVVPDFLLKVFFFFSNLEFYNIIKKEKYNFKYFIQWYSVDKKCLEPYIKNK